MATLTAARALVDLKACADEAELGEALGAVLRADVDSVPLPVWGCSDCTTKTECLIGGCKTAQAVTS